MSRAVDSSPYWLAVRHAVDGKDVKGRPTTLKNVRGELVALVIDLDEEVLHDENGEPNVAVAEAVGYVQRRVHQLVRDIEATLQPVLKPMTEAQPGLIDAVVGNHRRLYGERATPLSRKPMTEVLDGLTDAVKYGALYGPDCDLEARWADYNEAAAALGVDGLTSRDDIRDPGWDRVLAEADHERIDQKCIRCNDTGDEERLGKLAKISGHFHDLLEDAEKRDL